MWCRGVVVITTAQLHSTRSQLKFCAGSNPAHGVLEIRDDENFWQLSRLEIRLNAVRRSTIPQKQFIIIIIIKDCSQISSFLQVKKNFFRNYRNNKSNIQLLNELNFCPRAVKRLINKSKSNYYERIASKLNNLQRNRNSKPYWSLLCFLKIFLNVF